MKSKPTGRTPGCSATLVFLFSVVQDGRNPATEGFYGRTHGSEQRQRTMSRDAVDRVEILLVEDDLEDANVTIQALKQGIRTVCGNHWPGLLCCRPRSFSRSTGLHELGTALECWMSSLRIQKRYSIFASRTSGDRFNVKRMTSSPVAVQIL